MSTTGLAHFEVVSVAREKRVNGTIMLSVKLDLAGDACPFDDTASRGFLSLTIPNTPANLELFTLGAFLDIRIEHAAKKEPS